MGKAGELDDYLEAHPLTPKGIEARRGARPKLRLGRAVLDQALGPETEARGALDRLANGAKVTALYDPESGATAVVVPVEEYLELVTAHIRDRGLAEVGLNGQVAPSDATLSELGVEQVNPRETWLRIGDYDPSGPAPEI